MTITYSDAIEATKSITELAIQNHLITAATSNEETAKEIAKFYCTFYEELTKTDNN